MIMTKMGLAKVITAMNYGDLREVGEELACMKEPEVRPKIETAQEFADALFDWAQATVEE